MHASANVLCLGCSSNAKVLDPRRWLARAADLETAPNRIAHVELQELHPVSNARYFIASQSQTCHVFLLSLTQE